MLIRWLVCLLCMLMNMEQVLFLQQLYTVITHSWLSQTNKPVLYNNSISIVYRIKLFSPILPNNRTLSLLGSAKTSEQKTVSCNVTMKQQIKRGSKVKQGADSIIETFFPISLRQTEKQLWHDFLKYIYLSAS